MIVFDRESTEDTLHLDRRRAPRVSQQRPVRVYEPAASRFFGGQTLNVSSTGLQVEFPPFVQLSPGRLVHVHIGIEEGGRPLANRRSMVPARVVWSTQVTEGRECVRVGFEFLSFTTARAA